MAKIVNVQISHSGNFETRTIILTSFETLTDKIFEVKKEGKEKKGKSLTNLRAAQRCRANTNMAGALQRSPLITKATRLN